MSTRLPFRAPSYTRWEAWLSLYHRKVLIIAVPAAGAPRDGRFQNYNLLVAAAVGFIALAGVSAEFGAIMPLYLKQAWDARIEDGTTSHADLLDAIREGAVCAYGRKR